LSVVTPATIKKMLEQKCGIIYDDLKPTDEVWQKFEKQITFKAEG
jgi:hypothetical protein